jgi:hypothetical protein
MVETRRTKHKIHASRSVEEHVEIPGGAILRNVRTSDLAEAAGRPIPRSIASVVRAGSPNIHIFEYDGETLFMLFGEGLMEATDPFSD